MLHQSYVLLILIVIFEVFVVATHGILSIKDPEILQESSIDEVSFKVDRHNLFFVEYI